MPKHVTIDPTERLESIWEPAPLPPPALDGAPGPLPAATAPLQREPISLCMLGPCANYHELAVQIDAQKPQDGSASKVHVHVIRTCYPSTGIEMDIAMPVRRCNLWNPDPRAGLVGKGQTYMFDPNHRELVLEFEASWNPPVTDKKENDDAPR